MNYQEAEKLFLKARNKDRGYRLPGREGSTRLVKTDKGYGILLHQTIVVEFFKNGTYRLNSGGYFTKTTKERISLYSPASIISAKNVWYVAKGNLWPKPTGIGYDRWVQSKCIPFKDGILVSAKGKAVNSKGVLLKAPKPGKKSIHQKNEAKADKYAKGFVDVVLKGDFGRPSGGDCWYCSMQTESGQNFGDASSNEHIHTHIKERYYVPALLWNAFKEQGYKPEYVWEPFVERNPDRAQLKRTVKRYILKRLNQTVARNSRIVVGRPNPELQRQA